MVELHSIKDKVVKGYIEGSSIKRPVGMSQEVPQVDTLDCWSGFNWDQVFGVLGAICSSRALGLRGHLVQRSLGVPTPWALDLAVTILLSAEVRDCILSEFVPGPSESLE